MILLGFSLSNFCLWPNRRLDFLLKNLQRNIPQATAIELSHRYPLEKILANQKFFKKYRYRSFHLPKKGTARWIKDLNENQKILNLNSLIIHPNVVKSFNNLAKSKIPVLVENMDNHKKSFKAPNELKTLFNRYSFLKMCLDINHLETNLLGPAAKWLKDFNKQIFQIHLSGIDNYYYEKPAKKDLRHSLCLYDKKILDGIKTIKNRPIILEGVIPPNRWDLAKQEFNLVKNFLK